MGLFFIADDYYGQPNKGRLTSTTAGARAVCGPLCQTEIMHACGQLKTNTI